MVAALVAPSQPDTPLIVVVGATASGKSSLAIHLAEAFGGEVVSCDSVAVYREMEIGTAKPSFEDRTRIPHHMIDVVYPDEACTAGDYSRLAREALAGIRERGHLPIVAGGTGLYLRALIEGLFPAPPRQPELRADLRRQASEDGPEHLHAMLAKLDPAAAAAIHANDISKVIRAIEVSLAAQQPLTEQWQKGRDALTGYRILRIGLDPGRERLYERINQRAAAMFDRGLIEETARVAARYGFDCRPLTSLGYAESVAVLRGECTREQAVARAQQGHRNYAKRQGTWFRRDKDIAWLHGTGGDSEILKAAASLVYTHLQP
jgi:tRNA dimethylallyltransferase